MVFGLCVFVWCMLYSCDGVSLQMRMKRTKKCKKHFSPRAKLWTVWCLSGHETILNTTFMHAHIDMYYQSVACRSPESANTHTHTVHSADVVPPQHAEQHKSRLLMGLSHRASLYFFTPSNPPSPSLSPHSFPIFLPLPLSLSPPLSRSCPSVHLQV